MDRDHIETRALYTMLGEISSDIKHLLNAVHENGADIEKLRVETQKDIASLNKRVSTVEKSNIKMVAYASTAMLFIVPVVTKGLGFIVEKFHG